MAAAGVPGARGGRRRARRCATTRRSRRSASGRLPAPREGERSAAAAAGMRVVERARRRSPTTVGGASREAASAFGDGTVFLERLVVAPRHVEVQVLGDAHGTVVHLFERECSIQRRHQKLARGVAVAGDLRATRTAMLRRGGRGGTRHRLRERGHRRVRRRPRRALLLPRGQHAPAGRAPRDRARDRPRPRRAPAPGRRGRHARRVGHRGDVHAATRSRSGCTPRTPTTTTSPTRAASRASRSPLTDGVRVDAGYATGSVVSTSYDAMLAKVIAWAPTSASRPPGGSRRRCAGARLHGVTTNRDLLVGRARDDEFLEGANRHRVPRAPRRRRADRGGRATPTSRCCCVLAAHLAAARATGAVAAAERHARGVAQRRTRRPAPHLPAARRRPRGLDHRAPTALAGVDARRRADRVRRRRGRRARAVAASSTAARSRADVAVVGDDRLRRRHARARVALAEVPRLRARRRRGGAGLAARATPRRGAPRDSLGR